MVVYFCDTCYIMFICKHNTITFPIASPTFLIPPSNWFAPSLWLTSSRLSLQLATCLLFTLQQGYLYFQGSPKKERGWKRKLYIILGSQLQFFGPKTELWSFFGLKLRDFCILLRNSMHKLTWELQQLISFVPLRLSHKKTIPNRTSKTN